MCTGFSLGPGYVAAFVFIRLAAWVALAVLTGWIGDPVWLAGHAALAVSIVLYNLIPSGSFRVGTFFQMTCLRFVLPVLAAMPPDGIYPLLFASVFYYIFFRFLSYLESKELLEMPDRRLPVFGITQVGALAPLLLFVAFATGERVMAELLVYLAVFYGGYAVFPRQ